LVELPEFEPILGSENSFSITKWNSFSNSRWLTEAEIASTEDLGNRNALGFHIPNGYKILTSINVIYKKIHQTHQKRGKRFC
jgi:23S rRNA (uracil1939-C5)-methyltransferase